MNTALRGFTTTARCATLGVIFLPGRAAVTGNKISKMSSLTGLFDFPEFTTPSQFSVEAVKCIQRSRILVEEIVDYQSFDIALIDKMDLLSDELCRVADLSECIRQVHPNKKMAEAAEKACLKINAFVEELNTNTGLYKALNKFMTDSKFSSLDRMTQRTSKVFMHDFEASGIFLKDSLRKQVVRLNENLLEIGYKYVHQSSDPTLVKANQCPHEFDMYFEQYRGNYVVNHVLYYNKDRNLRKQSYLHYYKDNQEQLETFESLINKRQELSNLVGYKSFSHRVLKMAMAESPDTVIDFLECLSEKVLPLAIEDVEVLKRLGDTSDVGPWDVPMVMQAFHNQMPMGDLKSMKEWFPLDACIAGLGNLFKSLFGVTLEVAPVKVGEVWHQDVFKFNFKDKNGNLIGCTYGDLIQRDDRSAVDCHFTIRGGREQVFAFPDGDTTVSEHHKGYQLPVITLCCSAEKPLGRKEQSLLSRHSVETLFHEMGHALHSMLGRARYQNVTGTRCPTDFAEVPSILMEFFVYDQRVIGSFARHHRSGQPLPQQLLAAFQLSDHSFAAYDTQVQIFHSFLDQAFHTMSNQQLASGWSSNVFKEMATKYFPLGHTPGTSSYLRFPHLCGYGGRYYSYLWSRAVASLIWKSFFQSDPFSRENGEKYRTMLSYGGGASPRELVRDLLGFEPSVSDLVHTLYTDILEQRKRIAKLSSGYIM